jgi:SNF2 family DNA or RNA helicase
MFRKPGAFRAELSSGIDWFELHGGVDYGDGEVKLPELLKAIQKGEHMVRLSDGTFGIIPDELLERYGMLVGFGQTKGDHIQFSRAQAGLLDVLLADRPEIQVDEMFARARAELRNFDGIAAAQQPAGFVGELRHYQREGLGWMDFLRRFGIGGCLADDMGVGKTPQVLAMLEARRQLRGDTAENGNGDATRIGPSLVVVPRSLVYNWQQEAARFCPQLRVLDHTGVGRVKDVAQFENFDVILTTYGTLRRDVVDFESVRFDYAVLDEAQAIKNAGSESAKAARLLQANHRLVMSGTPVENHLGELWSLFEFLNPGMLGTASVFQSAGGALRNPDEASRELLAKAVRPFILRRTKDQVATELPAKLEQTLFCELDVVQRKLYNEMRDHFRNSLLKNVEAVGLAKSKMMILEALLRLRQAACHPGLIDKKRVGESSAKLEILLAQLSQVMDEGHKALVFSQFTSMLAIVRENLDRDGVVYEYLDGKTKDRQARVERFQNDPECKLFLVSLKAGGVGLNLTAAEYVFLLDPWWNPAVEMQAIDRAHRIGQSKRVFAYRLIARETVEEKVLELQEKKRALADAIINADNRLVGDMKREDLELLFS